MLVNFYQLTQCHIQADNILYYTFHHGITKYSNMYCIMTQEWAMSHSTVRSRNTFHLSWCVTVQAHSGKAACTKQGIWLSLDTATTVLSRMLAMFKRAYIYFNFTKFFSLYELQRYSYSILKQFVQYDDVFCKCLLEGFFVI
jgi:hypothetical protein